MGLFAYGTAVICCLFVLCSMGQLMYQHWCEYEKLWKDTYFWLATGLTLAALGFGEWGAMRVVQTIQGHVQYAQNPTLALFVAITLILAINSIMRAVAIQHPVRGRWYIILCAAWGGFSLYWTSA